MALEKTTTPEGLRVYVDTLPATETARINVFVGAGSVHEPDKLAGISHALEHCTSSSTELFPNIKSFYDFCGMHSIESNAYTSHTHTLYYGNGPFVRPIMKSMGDYLFRATYDPDQITKEMLAINREAEMYVDDISGKHFTAIDYGLFGKPYGRDIIGYAGKLNFSPDQLKKYYKRHYALSNMAVVAVGNVRMEELMRNIDDYFDHTSRTAEPIVPRSPRRLDAKTTGLLHEEADNAQLSVAAAMDRTFVRRYLAQPILFDAAMTAIQTRCHENLRYNAGISYDGTAEFHTENHPDAWSIQGTVTIAPKKIKQARKIFAEVFQQTAESYSDTEIAAAIGNVRGGILQKMDSLNSRADIYVQNLDCSEEPEDLSIAVNIARNLSHEQVRSGVNEIVDYLSTRRPLTHITGPAKAVKNVDILIDQADFS